MSAWSGLVALSGFHYRGTERAVTALPRTRAANFSSFWSTGTGWGVFSQSSQDGRSRFTLSVLAGKLPCQSVEVARGAAGAKSSVTVGQQALGHRLQVSGKQVTFILTEPIELAEGQRLVLEV
jgi:hypothetical protein